MTTKIEWTDEVLNLVTGCTHSGMPGCDNCYARRLFPRVYGDYEHRLEVGQGYTKIRQRKFSDVHTHPDRLDKPLHWRKPRRVFCCSMGDLFHEGVPDEFIAAAFGVMAACPQHSFQVLTKRPKRMRSWFEWVAAQCVARGSGSWAVSEAGICSQHLHKLLRPIGFSGQPWPLPNAWLGCSVSNQEDLERVAGDLIATPAAVHYISYEPALGPVDFHSWFWDGHKCSGPMEPEEWDEHPADLIDLVIPGGESGPKARRCDIEWIRSVVEQCKAAGVACFVKQLGANPGRLVARTWHPWPGTGKRNDLAGFPEDLRVREMPK